MRKLLPLLFLVGCVEYTGGARPLAPQALAEPGWIAVPSVHAIHQAGEHDCGAAAAGMLLEYWRLPAPPLHDASGNGFSAGFLSRYLQGKGLTAALFEGTVDDLTHELAAGRPVLVGVWKPYSTRAYAHYEVVVGVNPRTRQIAVVDPADGWRVYSIFDFDREWAPARRLTMVVSPPATE